MRAVITIMGTVDFANPLSPCSSSKLPLPPCENMERDWASFGAADKSSDEVVDGDLVSCVGEVGSESRGDL